MKIVVLLDTRSIYCVVFGPYREKEIAGYERRVRERYGAPDCKVVVSEMTYPDRTEDGWIGRNHRLDFAQWEELKAIDAIWSVVLSVPGRDCCVYGPYTEDGAKIVARMLRDKRSAATHACPRQVRKTLSLERRDRLKL